MPSRPHAPNYGSKDFKYSGPLSFAWPDIPQPGTLLCRGIRQDYIKGTDLFTGMAGTLQRLYASFDTVHKWPGSVLGDQS